MLKLKANQEDAMGHLGKIKRLNELPSDKILISYIKEAARLNDEGIKLPPRKKDGEKKELIIPEYFTKELNKNKTAYKIFEAFSPSHKKEYVEWVTSAKTQETKNKRMAKALEQIAEGKGLNWKYQTPKQPS